MYLKKNQKTLKTKEPYNELKSCHFIETNTISLSLNCPLHASKNIPVFFITLKVNTMKEEILRNAIHS